MGRGGEAKALPGRDNEDTAMRQSGMGGVVRSGKRCPCGMCF